MFLLSNTLSFCLLPSLASFFLSLARSLTRSFTFSPRCDASGPSETGSQHKERHSLCLNDTLHYGRHITCLRGVAGSGVTRMDAILAQTSSQPPPPALLFHLHMCFKVDNVCVYLCPSPENSSGTTPKSPISDAVASAASSRLCPSPPGSAAPPRVGGLVLLLTGVICASGIDVVCQPIKIFDGNVYFLERIAPAAWKLFLNKAIYA